MLCVNGTSLFPPLEEFEDAVLFLENSEDKPSPVMMPYFLRTLGIMGILERIKGILFARSGGEFLPQDETEKIRWVNMYTEFDETFIRICNEFSREDLPIVTNMNFGHTVPQLIFPYGAMVEINPINRTVAILESAVKYICLIDCRCLKMRNRLSIQRKAVSFLGMCIFFKEGITLACSLKLNTERKLLRYYIFIFRAQSNSAISLADDELEFICYNNDGPKMTSLKR